MVSAILLAVKGLNLSAAVAFLSVGAAGCGVLFGSGLRRRRRALRFEAYRKELRGMSFCSLAHLAQAVGPIRALCGERYQTHDRAGLFPAGPPGCTGNMPDLDHETYARYLEAEESENSREEEDERRRQQPQK